MSFAIAARGQRAEVVADAERMADALARTFALWRDRNYARRRDAVEAIARTAGYSVAMLEESIDALLKPFTSDALMAFAARISADGRSDRPKTVGFIAAGNVAGAGIHEVAIALIAGARVIVKTASAEPVFFAEFSRTLAEIDREAGARIEVQHWNRGRADLTAAMMANCELVVAYGDDSTIESVAGANVRPTELRRLNVIDFGSRVSGAVIAINPSHIDAIADSLARDVVLFEQLGCLSPHQVFVIGASSSAAREFAVRMAGALEQLSESMPPARIPLSDAVEIRGVRERARWRGIAGEAVELFEGRGLEWTVVFEARGDAFKVSPGFRTVHVTGVRDIGELRGCLAGATGRVEAIAVVGGESGDSLGETVASLGIPYVCAPGEMQSPPLEWRHGGGAFLDLMVRPR